MPEQLLDGPDVVPVLEQVGRKRVAEDMAGDVLGNAGSSSGLRHGALEHGLMQVVPAPLPCRPVQVEARGRKHPLPRPLPGRVQLLLRQSPGKLDPAGPALEILLVLSLHELEVPRQAGLDGGE